MTYMGGALAYWVSQYNAVVATLATRTSERDSARNSLYVSGVYGSGVTWQQQDATDLANYNAEVSAYNAMVTDRNTWQSRANSAWGASGVWSSGASYQSQLPPSARQSFVAPATATLGTAGGTATANYGAATDNGLGATNGTTSVTVPKAGIYDIWCALIGSNNTGNTGDTSTFTLTGNAHGTLDSHGFSVIVDHVAGYVRYRGALNTSEVVSLTVATSFDAFSISGEMSITFVPTLANPN